MHSKIQEGYLLAHPESVTYFGFIQHEGYQVGKLTYLRTIIMTQEIFDARYNFVDSQIKQAAQGHLVGRICQVYGFTGPNIIEDLKKLVGTRFNPEKCEPGSLRKQLWNRGTMRFPLLLGENKRYHFTFVEASRSEEEAREQLPVLLGDFYTGPIVTW